MARSATVTVICQYSNSYFSKGLVRFNTSYAKVKKLVYKLLIKNYRIKQEN